MNRDMYLRKKYVWRPGEIEVEEDLTPTSQPVMQKGDKEGKTESDRDESV